MPQNSSRNKSNSTPQICGDIKLSFREKINYILLNYKNNIKNEELDERVQFLQYRPSFNYDKCWKGIEEEPPSPARFLCNEFWSDYDFSPLIKSNGQLRVLEVGCGTGVYGLRLRQKLRDKLELYRGVDIVSNPKWIEMPSDFEFYVDRAENIGSHLKDVNLIITQSAVEHFEFDITFFRQIEEYLRKTDHDVWQIHLLPSAECLATYLWHGYRQYTPGKLSKITKLYSDQFSFNIYRMGGAWMNALHLWMITIPNIIFRIDIRSHFKNLYCRLLARCYFMDSSRKNETSTSFYGLVIKKNQRIL